ncbi:MAG: efflux transporter outer membrane subunit [Gammaproteobacteria bacterium]|nr:efflux transporter outer membrane subunit [Gammaproteobacteria bacterium]
MAPLSIAKLCRAVPALLLVACAGTAPRAPAPPPALDWAHADLPAAWPSLEWFKAFGSPELDTLMTAALADNLDLEAAAERVVQADARARQAHAAILPSVDLAANANSFAGHSPAGTLHETDWSAGLSASYEVDFWGKNRAKARSASYLSTAARADRETVRLTTQAGVANTYFEVVTLRERLATAHANVEAAQKLLEVVQARYRAGYATPVDVANQAAAVATLRAGIPDLEQSESKALAALAVLLGRPPEHFDVAAQTLGGLSEPSVAPGLPAELLRRRPDVAQAEANLSAAHADLRAAQAAFLPSLTLTATAGVQNPAVNAAVNTLSGVGPAVTLGAALAQAIFDGGKLRAQRDEARGRELELLASYRASILDALVDVENSLSAIARLDAARADQQAAVAQSERAYEGARERYQHGYGDFLSVLEAQRTLYSARDQFAQYRLARLQAVVALCKALGGGWEVTQPDARVARQPPPSSAP